MLLGVSLALCGPVAQEQSPTGRFPDWSTPLMMSASWGWSPGVQQWVGGHMIERIEGWLAYVEGKLGVTDGQHLAWERFAEEVRKTGQAHNGMMRQVWTAAGDPTQSTPARIWEQIEMLQAQISRLQALQAAVEDLYTGLDASQQAEADAQLSVLSAPAYRQVWR